MAEILNLTNAVGLGLKDAEKYLIFVDPRCVDLQALGLAPCDIDAEVMPILPLPGQSIMDCVAVLSEDRIQAAVLAQRESCAKIAESYTSPTDDTLYGLAARDIAAKIREGQ